MARPMTLSPALMIDDGQLRGALRALRELQFGAEPPVPSCGSSNVMHVGAESVPVTVQRITGISKISARSLFFLLLVCLACVAPISSEGRSAPQIPRPLKASRPLSGGLTQDFSEALGPEHVSMSFNTGHLFARVLVPSLLLIGSAQAGDASFLPNDTISVQGVPNVADDFTIECRLWIPSSSSPIMGSWSGIPGGSVFHAQRNSAMDTSLYVGPDGIYVMTVGPAPFTGLAFALPKNQWCHVAVVRNGSSIKAYLNGIQTGSISCSSARNALVTNADVRIGAPVHNGSGLIDRGFTGRIDWLRVSSVARYTANFTVPTEDSLIPADASTELLLRFNEAPGASQVRDDSPHHFASVVGDPSKFPSGTATAPRFPGPTVCPSDLDGDGEVNGSDISLLLLDFGPCP